MCTYGLGCNRLISMNSFFSRVADRNSTWSHLFLGPLLLSGHHVVTFMFFHGAEHANAHLVCPTKQLQTLLVLGADLPVQVTDFVHQLVPFEGGRFIVGLQVLLAVGGQAHQAGLDGLVLLPDADVAAYVLGSGVVVIRGGRRRREGLGGAWGRGISGASQAAWGGPLVVGDPALGALVGAGVVSVVPVCLQANGAQDVSTRDGHGVPEVLLAQVAGILVGHGGGRPVGVLWRRCVSSTSRVVTVKCDKVIPRVRPLHAL